METWGFAISFATCQPETDLYEYVGLVYTCRGMLVQTFWLSTNLDELT